MEKIFDNYFQILPWEQFPAGTLAFDMGAGRYDVLAFMRFGELHATDASKQAENVAREALVENHNLTFRHTATDANLIEPLDKILVCLNYHTDKSPSWFRAKLQAPNQLRRGICRLLPDTEALPTDFRTLVLHLPGSHLTWLLEKSRIRAGLAPLARYWNHSFATLRADIRNRFGTLLEQRFTRPEIVQITVYTSVTEITYLNRNPYWTAIKTRIAGTT